MNEIKRILFVDDDCESYKEDFENYYSSKGIEIIYCKTKDEGIRKLEDKYHFDLILLDWFLEDPESSVLSISFLSELRKRRFLPVFIWTHHLDNYEQELLKETIPYPKDLIRGISKEEFESPQLQEKVTDLYETCKIAHLSKFYRETIHKKLEEVFFELSEISGTNLIKIIKAIVGEAKNIDWSNDFILNLIHRLLISDKDFIKNIDFLLSESPSISITTEEEIRKEVINKIFYYKSNPNRLRCGDIIQIRNQDSCSKVAIIITPDCDLANAKTKFVELIELREINDSEIALSKSNKILIEKFNHPSFYYFPFVQCPDEYKDLVAILKSKIILMENVDNIKPYPSSSKLLEYSDNFYIDKTEYKIELICSLSEPYKSDFLNHLHSHNFRVGIPDIKKLWS